MIIDWEVYPWCGAQTFSLGFNTTSIATVTIGRQLDVKVLTSQYSIVRVATSQHRIVSTLTSQYRKIKVLILGE